MSIEDSEGNTEISDHRAERKNQRSVQDSFNFEDQDYWIY